MEESLGQLSLPKSATALIVTVKIVNTSLLSAFLSFYLGMLPLRFNELAQKLPANCLSLQNGNVPLNANGSAKRFDTGANNHQQKIKVLFSRLTRTNKISLTLKC